MYLLQDHIGDGTFESIERNIREAEKYQIALANREVGAVATVIAEKFYMNMHAAGAGQKRGFTDCAAPLSASQFPESI